MPANLVPAHPWSDAFSELRSQFPQFDAAVQHHLRGDTGKAQQLYSALVFIPPLTAACLHQVGVLAERQGAITDALALYRVALRLDTSQPVMFHSLSQALRRLEQLPQALGVLMEQGGLLQLGRHFAQAETPYREILRHDPLCYGVYVNLGTCLAQLRRLREALNLLLGALILYGRQDVHIAQFGDVLCKSLVRLGHDVSLPTLPPGLPTGSLEKIEDTLTTLGKVMTEFRCTEEAIACHRLSIKMAPGFALAHWNLALALLEADDFTEGWERYEWRWHWSGFPDAKRRLPMASWHGEPLQGKRIYVWAEQGFGDAIQFVPLVKRLLALGATVTLEVSPQLCRLFQVSLRSVLVLPRHPDNAALAVKQGQDFSVSLMSLPHLLQLRSEDLPLDRNYLCAPSQAIDIWKLHLGRLRQLRVGIVWSGRATPDPRRSIPFAALAPLFNRRTIKWVSLQVGDAAMELPQAGNAAIENLAPRLSDFSDTAAAMMALDLVISIDSAPAHLAGALGRPVWVLLPRVADWRWKSQGGLSPWYPSMRLFRQTVDNQWTHVINEVGDALDRLDTE